LKLTASAKKELEEDEMLDNGDRVFKIPSFLQEPTLGLTVSMSMKDVSGLEFDSSKAKLTVDSRLALRGEEIEIEVTGSL
jgi:hypothetical protein